MGTAWMTDPEKLKILRGEKKVKSFAVPKGLQDIMDRNSRKDGADFEIEVMKDLSREPWNLNIECMKYRKGDFNFSLREDSSWSIPCEVKRKGIFSSKSGLPQRTMVIYEGEAKEFGYFGNKAEGRSILALFYFHLRNIPESYVIFPSKELMLVSPERVVKPWEKGIVGSIGYDRLIEECPNCVVIKERSPWYRSILYIARSVEGVEDRAEGIEQYKEKLDKLLSSLFRGGVK